MRQLEEQERHVGAEPDGDDHAAAILGALPSQLIDPLLAMQALRAVRTELEVAQQSGGSARRCFSRGCSCRRLWSCAAGRAYHFIAVAQHLYASH